MTQNNLTCRIWYSWIPWNSAIYTSLRSPALFRHFQFVQTRLILILQHQEQIEPVLMSLKNTYGIICRNRSILYQIIFLIGIDTCDTDGFASSVKYHLISKYGLNFKMRVRTFVSVNHVHAVLIYCSQLTTTYIFYLHRYSVFQLRPLLIHSLRPHYAYMHMLTGSSLFQIMAWFLFGAEPKSKPRMGCC